MGKVMGYLQVMASPLYRHGKLILQDWGIRYPVGHTVGNRLARSEDAVLHSIRTFVKPKLSNPAPMP